MKKFTFLFIYFSLPFSTIFLFGIEKTNLEVTCKQKEETIKTIFQLLPDSERSCPEIAKLVLTEEDEEGEKLDKEYQELFLKVCELKRKKRTLEEIRDNLGLTKQCNSYQSVTKKN